MSHDLVLILIGVLRSQARAFDALRKVMAQNRGAFVSLGAHGLQTGIEELDSPAMDLADLEAKRQRIIEELGPELGFEGDPCVSRITPLLPDDLGRSLRHAADTAAEAARRVHVECRVGTRLLRLSEDVNASIIESLLGLGQGHNAFYDRNARCQPTDTPGGSIVSGTA